MPADPLDGIKTKRGRVVYDREKHLWNEKDLIRVMEKWRAKLANDWEAIDCYKLEMVGKHTTYLLRAIFSGLNIQACDELAGVLAREVEGVASDFRRFFPGFGGGDFGGAGATRDY